MFLAFIPWGSAPLGYIGRGRGTLGILVRARDKALVDLAILAPASPNTQTLLEVRRIAGGGICCGARRTSISLLQGRRHGRRDVFGAFGRVAYLTGRAGRGLAARGEGEGKDDRVQEGVVNYFDVRGIDGLLFRR